MCTKFTNVVIGTSEIPFYELQLDSFQGAGFPFNVVLWISSAIRSGFIWNKSVSVVIFELFCKWQEFSWKRSFTGIKRVSAAGGWLLLGEIGVFPAYLPASTEGGYSDIWAFSFQSYCKAIGGFPSIQQKYLALTTVLSGYISILPL